MTAQRIEVMMAFCTGMLVMLMVCALVAAAVITIGCRP